MPLWTEVQSPGIDRVEEFVEPSRRMIGPLVELEESWLAADESCRNCSESDRSLVTV